MNTVKSLADLMQLQGLSQSLEAKKPKVLQYDPNEPTKLYVSHDLGASFVLESKTNEPHSEEWKELVSQYVELSGKYGVRFYLKNSPSQVICKQHAVALDYLK